MGAGAIARDATGLDGAHGRRLGLALGGSVAAHAVALGIWALTYDPTPVNLEPTPRRVVKAIALTRAPRPAPIPAPEPEPEPQPQPQLDPPPEDLPEPADAPDRPRGPPPPPAACKNCAMMPNALGVPKTPARGKAAGAIPWGVPGGVPGGVVGGVPGGVVGGVLGGDPSALGGAGVPLTPAKRTEPPRPLEAVMQQAIFTPPPSPDRLAKTKTALFSRHSGVNRTAFCIDRQGKTTAVRTSKRFKGDPQIDQICRDTVKRWRFKPFLVAGKPKRVCSVAVFEIEFE